VREALFARLGDLEGARVLDLYAGSGALGIEALSRGAASALFVEHSERVARVLRGNLETLELGEIAAVVRGDSAAVVRRLARRGQRFDLVFLDPPYGRSQEVAQALAGLGASGVLEAGAMIVVEARRGAAFSVPDAFEALDERRYGDTVIHRLARAAGPGAPGGPAGAGAAQASAAREECTTMQGASAARRSGPRDGQRALFAASFDPVTNGHLDLVQRAKPLFPELIVAVARNVAKQGTFTAEERLEMLESVLGPEPGLRITAFDGLLVDYARQIGAHVLIRGLRAVSDFEYEFEMALMNRRLYPEIETLFLMTSQQFFYVSSSRLKELVRFGANVEDFVPEIVAKKLKEKLGGRS
jgi:pantetheine-phosphate adenylyltransferase